MSILDRYLLIGFLGVFPACMALGCGVFVLADFFLQIGELTEHGTDMSMVAAYFAFKLPRVVTEIYPAAALLGVLVGIGALADRREILAMRACGVAFLRLLVPLAVAGTVLSIGVLFWNETVVPPSASRAREIRDIGIERRMQTGFFNASSIWFQNDQGFVNIDYFDAAQNRLYGVTIHVLDSAFALESVIEIPLATWGTDGWDFDEGTITEFRGDGAHVREVTRRDVVLDANPDELRRKRRRSYEFSYTELRRQIASLHRKGLDAREYVVDLHYKLASPFAGLVAIVLGFPLAARGGKRGSGGMLQNVGTGLAVSFLYWSATALSVSAGHAGTVPPLVAAWAPNVVFGLGGLALYATAEA